jgi:hypothetical protein
MGQKFIEPPPFDLDRCYQVTPLRRPRRRRTHTRPRAAWPEASAPSPAELLTRPPPCPSASAPAGLVVAHAAHLRAVARLRPHVGAAQVRGRHARDGGAHQPGSGPGAQGGRRRARGQRATAGWPERPERQQATAHRAAPQLPSGAAAPRVRARGAAEAHAPRSARCCAGATAHRGGAGQRRLGCAAELPPGGQLDAHAGAAGGGALRRHHLALLPAVAHVLPLARLPGQRAAERHQDDQRPAQGPARQPPGLLPVRPLQRPRLLRGLYAARGLQEAAVRAVLLPRVRAGGAPGGGARAQTLGCPAQLRTP